MDLVFHEIIVTRNNMATKDEHPERYEWWLNELNTLGIAPNKVNELNDINGVSNLAKNLKQCYYQDYKSK
jgi:hypothetical protein